MAERDANEVSKLAADVERGISKPFNDRREATTILARAALDELVALVGTLQQERDDWIRSAEQSVLVWEAREQKQHDRAEAAEAALAEALEASQIHVHQAIAAEAALAASNACLGREQTGDETAGDWTAVEPEDEVAVLRKRIDRLQRQVGELARAARSEQVRANNAEAALAEMEQRWLGMRDCYDREVIRCGKAERALATTRQALTEATQALSDASLIAEAEEDDWQVTVYRLLCRQWDIARRALAEGRRDTGGDTKEPA